MTFYKLQHRYKPDPVRLQLTELKKLQRVTVHLVVTQEKYSVAAQHEQKKETDMVALGKKFN